MAAAIENLAGKLEYREPQVRGNLTLFPLFFKAEAEPIPYLLLEEAIAMGGLTIEEASQEGNVNAVFITNNAGQPVLILDGDEILGAKQNRMVNATVLIAVGKRVEVPVSCVERGRWSRRSPVFDRAGEFGYSTLRKQKAEQVACCLKRTQRFDADQGAIWEEIDRKQAAVGAHSETDALHEIYRKKEDDLKSMIALLKLEEGQTGVAVFINNNFVCLDLFDRPEIFPKVWGKLLKSYAMEALGAKTDSERPSKPDLQSIINSIRNSECSTYPSVSLGSDLRLTGAGIVGAGLALEDRVLHLSVFNKES
jgi:hypothetical protein